MARTLTAKEFWERVDRSKDCWEWRGYRNWAGYGIIHPTPGVKLRTHRIAYELTHGPIPIGLYVLHRCDNPSCVRPEHLFLGTLADNNRDMAAKGRAIGWQAGKTACKRGHPFSPENTRIIPSTGERRCRVCLRAIAHQGRVKRRARTAQAA